MSYLKFPAISVFLKLLIVSASFILFCLVPAHADSISDILSPGDVIKGHLKIESECAKCHKKFDKSAQSGLCKDCHKDVAKDIVEKHGYHGHLKQEKECRECHTEHKGRDARIAEFIK